MNERVERTRTNHNLGTPGTPNERTNERGRPNERRRTQQGTAERRYGNGEWEIHAMNELNSNEVWVRSVVRPVNLLIATHARARARARDAKERGRTAH